MVGHIDLVDHLKLDQLFNNKEGKTALKVVELQCGHLKGGLSCSPGPCPLVPPESSPFVCPADWLFVSPFSGRFPEPGVIVHSTRLQKPTITLK